MTSILLTSSHALAAVEYGIVRLCQGLILSIVLPLVALVAVDLVIYTCRLAVNYTLQFIYSQHHSQVIYNNQVASSLEDASSKQRVIYYTIVTNGYQVVVVRDLLLDFKFNTTGAVRSVLNSCHALLHRSRASPSPTTTTTSSTTTSSSTSWVENGVRISSNCYRRGKQLLFDKLINKQED